MLKFILVVFLFPIFSLSANEDIHLIQVNGVAEASIEPNMVTLLIESWGKSSIAKSAQETQAAQYKKIVAVIDKYKIKKDDFKTENFSVYPEYTYDQKSRLSRVSEFRASHQIKIILKKIEDVGNFVDDLVAISKNDSSAGVGIQNIIWDTDKRSIFESSTINEAVRSARGRAEELAKAAGVKIKAVHRISHNSYTPQQTFSTSSMVKAHASLESDQSTGTQLSSGKIQIRVEVQMEFEI